MRILNVISVSHTLPRNCLTAQVSYKNNIYLFSHEYVGVYFLKSWWNAAEGICVYDRIFKTKLQSLDVM
jgi:hypothetical protein